MVRAVVDDKTYGRVAEYRRGMMRVMGILNRARG